MLGFFGGSNLVRRMEQRFGGNATPVQTNAPEPFVALDEDDFFTKVGRVKCRSISARAGTNDDDFSLNRIHDSKAD